MTKDDLLNLDVLKDSDLIRATKKGNDLHLLIVGDNEEEEHHPHHITEAELGDEQQEYLQEPDHDACDEMNGHLFLLIFKNVSSLSLPDKEFDSYRTRKVQREDNSLSLTYLGVAFDLPEEEVTISFHYESYEIIDKGKITGPDI